MIDLYEYQQNNKVYADYLPQICMVDESTILNKNNIFTRTAKVKGFDFISLDDYSILSIQEIANQLFRRFEEGWYCHYEISKNEIEPYVKDTFPDHFTQRLEDIRYESAKKYKFFEISKYITIGYQAGAAGRDKVNKYLFKKDEVGSIEEEYNFFHNETVNFFNMMTNGFLEVEVLKNEELLSYHHYTTTLKKNKFAMPDIPFGLDNMLATSLPQGSCPLKLDDYYIYTGSVVDYPSLTRIGMLDKLSSLPFEFRWSTRYIPLGGMESLKYAKKMRQIYHGKAAGGFSGFLKKLLGNQDENLTNTEDMNKLEGIEEALDIIGKELASFGYLTTVFIVWDKDERKARLKLDEIKKSIENEGIGVRVEDFNTFQSFLGAIPAQVHANVRKPILNTVNFSHVVQLSSEWNGERENIHFKKTCNNGNPLLLATTTGETPFYLNLHVGDVGHTLILGPTGSGKSTLLTMLEASFLRYPKSGVVIFDKDKSALNLTRNVKGSFYELGVEEEEEGNVILQPLKIKTNEDVNWAVEWIKEILLVNNIVPEVKMVEEIRNTLTNIQHTKNDNDKTMSYFYNLIQDETVKNVIQAYTKNGAYGSIFDGNEDYIEESRWVMFEMGEIMKRGEEVVIPAMSYLFHKVEQAFDGNPKLIVIDEGWQVFKNKMFTEKVMEWLRTLRKKNCSVIFATQEISQMDGIKGLIDTLINACMTTIYLPNPSALKISDIYQKFGLNEEEIKLLTKLQMKKDYYYKNVNGSRVFNLELDAEQLNIIRGE